MCLKIRTKITYAPRTKITYAPRFFLHLVLPTRPSESHSSHASESHTHTLMCFHLAAGWRVNVDSLNTREIPQEGYSATQWCWCLPISPEALLSGEPANYEWVFIFLLSCDMIDVYDWPSGQRGRRRTTKHTHIQLPIAPSRGPKS